MLEILQQRWLIAFDDEVIVSELGADETGDLALGEQRIGGDVFVLEIQPREQRDRGFDFVGLFDGVRIACYGQNTDFFWA